MAGRLPRTVAAAIALCGLFSPGVARAQTQPMTVAAVAPTRHWNGQALAPVFEGFDTNPDGSFNLWYGYMNRNFEEDIDLPTGADNKIEPGGPDQGQPTHFEVRRHKDVFKITVPKDFNRATKLVWTVTVHGQTMAVAGSIDPVWQIDRRRTTRGGNINDIDSNLPPTVEMLRCSPPSLLSASTSPSMGRHSILLMAGPMPN